MKRRLLSAFLAVMMVLTMAPVAFAADEGDTAPQSSVSLPANNTGDFTISEEGAVLDGAGVTYKNGTITVTAADVTIKNLTFGDKAKLVVNTSGKFTLTGCTFTPETVCDNATKLPVRTAVTLNVGEAEVTNNTFGGITNGYYNAIEFGIGASNNDLSKAVISGNTFNSAIRNNYFNFYNMTPNAQIDIVNNKLLLAEKSSNGIRISNFRNATGVTFKIDSDEYTYAADSADSVYEGLILLQDYSKGSDVQNFSGITINVTKLSAPKSAKQLLYVYDDHTQSIITTNQPKLTGDDSLAQFYAAKIGDTYYKTLAEAVSAADNNTVTLLKNTVEDVVIPADKTITLDLNGKKIVNSTTAQDSKVAYDARKHTITNNGTLTIMDSVGGGVVDNVSHGRAALYNNGTITEIKGGKFTRSVDNSTDSESANGNSWYVVYNAEGATISKISNGEFLALGHFSSLFSNCGTINEISGGTFTQDHFIAFKNEGTVNKISGGVFSSTDESCIQNWGTIGEICGGTITAGSLGIWNLSSDKYTSKGTVEKISDGVISGTKEAIRLSNYDVEDLNKSADSLTNWASATIVGGKINGALKVGNGTRVSISGGYFTVDPSTYCVTGKTGVSSGDSTYPWTVGEKIADTKPAEVADATVAATVDKNASEAAKDAAKDIGGATMAQNEAIKAATKNEANKNTIDADTMVDGKTVTQKLQKVDANITSNDVKIVYQTYIDVEVKDAAKENSNFTELTVELTPMYRVIAAQRGVTDYHVDVDKNTSSVNAVQIVGEKPLTLTGKYEVTLQLPNGFVVPSDNKLSIKHQKSSGVEYYTGTVDTTSAAKMVTFETNGFSPFTISAVAAYVGTTAYPTLQEAANAANIGDTIVVKNGASHDLTFTATKSVKVKNETGADVTVKFNGTDKKFGDGETETFTYTKPSSGGSSGGSSSGKTTYKVTTSAVNNGGVNASPSNAEKGATITITLSPDKGYKLDKLTVTDGSGKTVSTVKKSDTVYTFTMPASAVKVGVSYVKATETPSETKFNDVSANDWFASAVDYVTGKGMMNGTADNTFSPKANTTRGMVVTVLYRLENQPSTSAASFTDVASGAYYANAVAWANANGIVSGYGSGKFGPNDKVTREQLAAILYRYAQYKKYDVSGANSLDGYTDVQSVSSYAVPALQWANAAGVVTGKSGSKLDPKGNATRAEVAAMLMRFCENVK